MDKVTGFEIPAEKMDRAKKFFKKVFGWKIDAHKEVLYHIETVDTDKNWMPKEKGAINGGIFKRESKSNKVTVVVDVPSIEKTLKAVKGSGGKVVTGKTEAGEWGWWAEVMDTEGNILELWEDMD